MTERSLQASLANPLFFGLLEGISFLCLFCSPFLSPSYPLMAWLAVALTRVVVFAGIILPNRGTSGGLGAGRAGSFLGQGLLYQIPFWFSALLFPLQANQSVNAAIALSVQCVLLLGVAALSRWGFRIGAESFVFLLSLGWLLGWRAPGPWLAAAGVVFLFTCRGSWSERNWGWVLSPWQALALGVTWLVTFALPWLGLSPLPGARSFFSPLLPWVALLYLVAVMATLQCESEPNGEVESSLPFIVSGRVWLLFRRSACCLSGWAAVLALAGQGPEQILGCAVLGTAWWRAVELSARNWFTPDRAAWWSALELTVLWAALQGDLTEGTLVLALSLLCCGWVRCRRFTGSWTRPLDEASRGLDGVLSNGLRLAAPAKFAEKLIKETASVELDARLTSTAPTGFRDRLMQRLRETGGEADE